MIKWKEVYDYDNKDNISTEEKSNNEKIFKEFINARTDGNNKTALNYASFLKYRINKIINIKWC